MAKAKTVIETSKKPVKAVAPGKRAAKAAPAKV